jgi:hypothetical protein
VTDEVMSRLLDVVASSASNDVEQALSSDADFLPHPDERHSLLHVAYPWIVGGKGS